MSQAVNILIFNFNTVLLKNVFFSLSESLAALRSCKKIFGSEGNRTWNLSVGQHKKVWNCSLELISLILVTTDTSGPTPLIPVEWTQDG